MRKLSILLAAIFSLAFVSCEKRPTGEEILPPQFVSIAAEPDVKSARLTCELSSSYGVVSCGAYIYRNGKRNGREDAKLVDGSYNAIFYHLERAMDYEYDFYIVNESGETVFSSRSTFTTLSDWPEKKKCDYIDEWGVNHGQGITIDNMIWAPVNCGYHVDNFKHGKYYQWGRKSGFGYAGVDIESVSTSPIWTGKNGGEQSDVLYLPGTGSTYLNDWIMSGDAHYWNAGTEDAPIKSEFDPCPAGWRIPTGREIDYLNAQKVSQEEMGLIKGASYSSDGNTVFLSAGGGYVEDTYIPKDRGDKGYYWSAKAGHLLYLHYSGFVHGTMDNALASAQNIRCVQE